ncbi:MAG: YIP1 family protein, partial [Candidatus Desulforudis sp.]|nr:YIP1 family protein [Desulforudis sp.]
TAFALAVGPYLILAGFFLWYIKWLGYGAILHLTAQLLDGKGGPKGTLVAYGLAGLPAILMLPVEGLMVFTDPGETTASTILGLFSLAVFIWSVVLLVLGLREMHRLSTGRAVTVVLAPVGVVLLAAVIVLVLIISGIMTLFPALPDFPGGF